MKYSILSFLFILQAIINVNGTDNVSFNDNIYKNRDIGTYPPNSPYAKNSNAALNALIRWTLNKGRYHANQGDKQSEVVYGYSLCVGYIKPDACLECLKSTVPLLQKNCPNKNEAVAWTTKCMARVSTRFFHEKFDDWFLAHATGPTNVAKVDDFNRAMNNIALKLSAQAARGTKQLKFVSGTETYAGSQTIYMAMECTPDLSTELCRQCFSHIFKENKPCCSGKMAAALLSPNCYMRYSHENFLK